MGTEMTWPAGGLRPWSPPGTDRDGPSGRWDGLGGGFGPTNPRGAPQGLLGLGLWDPTLIARFCLKAFIAPVAPEVALG